MSVPSDVVASACLEASLLQKCLVRPGFPIRASHRSEGFLRTCEANPYRDPRQQPDVGLGPKES